MSLINDVFSELKHLDRGPRALRKFSALFFILTLVGSYLSYRHNIQILLITFNTVGLYSGLGLLFPNIVKPFHTGWMFLSLVLGWIISRVIVVIVFFLVVTPIGIIARVFGKQFIDAKFRSDQKSYWIPKEKKSIVDYRKIF